MTWVLVLASGCTERLSDAIPDTDVIAETLRGVPLQIVDAYPGFESNRRVAVPDYARMAEAVRALLASRCSGGR